jgi:hypothetical protein
MVAPSVGTADTAIFLRDPSPSPLLAARALWDKHSGAPGLLDGRGYTFNTQTYRYRRDNGTRVSDSQLRGAVRRVTAATELEMRKNTQQLMAGAILLSVWYSRMRDLMAALYRTIFVLSIGGWAFEDDTERNLFYLWTLLQFQRVDNFYLQLQNKTQVLNGQAMNRAGMYADWGNSFHQNLNLEQAIQGGRKEGKRVLGENEDHCHDDGERPGCVELAAQGWQPIHLIVPLGDAVCYSRCHCRIIYR